MRDFHLPGRSPVQALNGMAATSHPAATLAALDVLRDGGNAIDAAVAAVAVLCVVEPQATGIGGDCFVLYAPGDGGEVIAFNGSGRAPAAATPEWFAEQGVREISEDSVHAVTVPGAVDAWARLVADHGRKSLRELLEPAIRYAEEGYVVHARIAFDFELHAEVLAHDDTARRIFLPGGRPPGMGEVHRQPELGETLRRIAEAGRDGFYAGPVAEDMVNFLRGLGGCHTLDDFALTEGEYVTPIRTTYRGFEILECPPNGQGVAALIMLNVLSGYDLGELGPVSAERFHLLSEAGRLALADRDAFVADPGQVPVPVEALLSEAHADRLRRRIRRGRAMPEVPPPALPAVANTTYLCVVDRERNAVSFINSLFEPFGSGRVAPRSGVLLQNRGAGFVLDRAHPNCIAPGKRPMHTIIPGMAREGGRAVMPFGVMGASFQPYGHVHLLTNIIDHGCDVQTALDLPRVFHRDGVLEVERGVPETMVHELRRLGHEVAVPVKPHGGGQAIWIDRETGVLTGGSDPRKDGCALGY